MSFYLSLLLYVPFPVLSYLCLNRLLLSFGFPPISLEAAHTLSTLLMIILAHDWHVKVWCRSSLSLSFWEMQGHWCTLTTSASQIICNVMYFDSTQLKSHKILFLLPYTVNGYLDSPTYLDFLCFPCYTTELPSGIIFLLNEQHPLHFSLVWVYWSNFTFPSAVYEVSNVSTSSPTIIIHLFNHTHSSGCEVDSYCAFDFHSLND